MESIRTKDKLFLALVIPVALAAAYVYFWRASAVRKIETLAAEDRALVATEDFPLERQRSQQFLATAKAELSAEEKIPMPAAKVKAKVGDSIAARERAVLEIFRLSGLKVESSRNAYANSSDDELEPMASAVDVSSRDVLVRTGVRPNPVCRQYSVIGSYPKVCSALRLFAEREMAVIPDRVEMTAPSRWTCALWL